MTRSKLVYIALGLALLAFLAVIAIGPSRYKALAESRLLALINQGPIKVRLEQSQLNLTSLSAKEVKLFIPSIWSEFNFEELYAQLSPLSVLALSPSAALQAKLWNGAVLLQGKHSLISGDTTATINLQELSLSEVQQLDALGFEGGKLWLSSEPLSLSPNKLSGNLLLKVRDLQHPADKVVSGAIVGSASDVVIPRINDLNFQSSIALSNSKIDFNQLDLTSSLGKVRGSFTLRLADNRKIIGSYGDLEFDLSNDGATIFNLGRQFLESSGSARSNSNSLSAKRWRVQFDGKPRLKLDFKASE